MSAALACRFECLGCQCGVPMLSDLKVESISSAGIVWGCRVVIASAASLDSIGTSITTKLICEDVLVLLASNTELLTLIDKGSRRFELAVQGEIKSDGRHY